MNNQTVCRRHYNNGNLEGMKALRLVLNITDSPGIKLEGSLCLTSLTLSFSFPRSFWVALLTGHWAVFPDLPTWLLRFHTFVNSGKKYNLIRMTTGCNMCANKLFT